MKAFNRKTAILVTKLFFSIALLLLLAHSAQLNLTLFIQLFHHPLLLSGVITIFLSMMIICSYRWHILLSTQKIHLDYLTTIIATYIGAAFNNLLPGAVGGDLIRWLYLFKKTSHKKSSVLFSIFFDRIIGFLGIFIVMGAVFVYRFNYLQQQPKLFYLLLVFSLSCLSALCIFLILMLVSTRIKLDSWLTIRFPTQKWAHILSTFICTLRTYQTSLSSIMKCVLISILLQLITSYIITLLAKMMWMPSIAFTDYIIAVSITLVINLIPVTPGGIGIGEMAFANIISLLNPNLIAPFATIFLGYRFISMLAYLPGILFCLPYLTARKQNNQLQEVA